MPLLPGVLHNAERNFSVGGLWSVKKEEKLRLFRSKGLESEPRFLRLESERPRFLRRQGLGDKGVDSAAVTRSLCRRKVDLVCV